MTGTITTTAPPLTTYTPSHPAPSQPLPQQRQMLLVEAYEREQQERSKVNNESKTLQLLAEQRQKIPKELVPLYSESVSVDTEWMVKQAIWWTHYFHLIDGYFEAIKS